MVYRVFSLFLLGLALAVFASASVVADDKADKNSHEGKFVSAMTNSFSPLEDKGKEHSHTLAAGAKVLDLDGKECKIGDLKKGQRIRVTTKEGDIKIATKVEALKKQ